MIQMLRLMVFSIVRIIHYRLVMVSKLLEAGLECHTHVVKWICLHMKLQMRTDLIGGILNTRTVAKKRFILIYQTLITMINSGHDLKQL